ncbi:MAG: exported protein of unknown function [Candidatus Saccharibacteria bacterium]|nr:exported protein of unknown function [Candidatus Saccharibacteria bacterium]
MTDMNMHRYERGAINGWLLATIILIFVTLGVGAFAIWSYINYQDASKVEKTEIDKAVLDSNKTLEDKLEADFTAREKEPNRQFAGPDDYGRLTFDYPKTWSVYVDAADTNNGTYEAYLNPVTVPPVSKTQQYALRVTIAEKPYDEVIDSFDSLVKKNSLKSSTTQIQGTTATRLEGSFSEDIRGIAVIFKIRDKTVTLRTDADTFRADFDKLLATVNYNE